MESKKNGYYTLFIKDAVRDLKKGHSVIVYRMYQVNDIVECMKKEKPSIKINIVAEEDVYRLRGVLSE